VVRGLGIGLLLFTVLVGTWLGGTITALLRHHRFRLLATEDGLVAEDGLLTRRRVQLRLAKVQLVSTSEPLLRRWAGFGTVRIETAAARPDSGGTQQANALIPVVDAERLGGVVRMAIPDADVDPWTAPLHPPHPHALIRGLVAAGIRGVLLGGLLTLWLWPWGLLGGLVIPVSLLFAWLDFRHQGWLVTEHVVVARRGYWHQRTSIVARTKLQSVSVGQGPMRRRWGLARLNLRVAGSAVGLPDMGWDEAVEVLEQLSEAAARPGSLVAASEASSSGPQVEEDDRDGDHPHQAQGGDGEQHEQAGAEHGIVAPPLAEGERDGGASEHDSEERGQAGRGEHELGGERGLAIEPDLPAPVQSALPQEDHTLRGEEEGEEAMQRGDEDADHAARLLTHPRRGEG